jgi:hypothetical protein
VRITPGNPNSLDVRSKGEGEFLLRRRERLTRQQVAAGEVGDRERVAVPPIAEHELVCFANIPIDVQFTSHTTTSRGRMKCSASADGDEWIARGGQFQKCPWRCRRAGE